MGLPDKVRNSTGGVQVLPDAQMLTDKGLCGGPSAQIDRRLSKLAAPTRSRAAANIIPAR